MIKDNLQDKTRKGILWSSIERFGSQGVNFLFGILLARLLSPDDYGIIAMPMIFLALAQVFIDSGFANALIRKPDLKEEDLSTAFYFNIIVGVFCYLSLFVTSPYIADFYNTPILSSVLKVTALATLFNPLCIVQQTILTIRFDFKIQAKISVISALISGVVGVYMALEGFGVWSLAFSQVLSAAIRIILLWYVSKWRPKTGWSSNSFNYLWGFGSKLMLSSVFECIYQNMYTVVIGKFYTKDNLGYYTRAHHFAQLPSTNIYGVLKKVTLPVFSSIQEDEERLERVFGKFLRLSAFLIFPLMFALIGLAEPLIYVLLSEKWIASARLLQLLSLGMMWIPIDALNLSLLTVKGRSDLFLKLEIIKKVFGIIILILTIREGLLWICIGFVIYCLFEIISDTYYTGKYYNYGLLRQVKDFLPSLWLSIMILISTLLIAKFVEAPFLSLLLGGAASVAIFGGGGKLFGMREYSDIKEFVKIKKE